MIDGSFFGLLRGIGFACVLDGLIVFWEMRSEKLTDKKQRNWSNGMKWAGIVMLLAIAASYVFVSLVPVDALKTVDVFGLVFSSTVRELIHWLIVGVISFWVVLTLGVVMYVRQIDPETKKIIKLTEAHEEQEREELQAYKTALKAIGRTVGTEKAIKRLRDNLTVDGYQPVDVDALVNKAQVEIKASRGESIPVEMKQFAASVDTVNPTPSANKSRQ
jgi:hypothetical protein